MIFVACGLMAAMSLPVTLAWRYKYDGERAADDDEREQQRENLMSQSDNLIHQFGLGGEFVSDSFMAISGWRVWLERAAGCEECPRSDFSGCRRARRSRAIRRPCGRRWPGLPGFEGSELARAKNRLQRENHAQNRQHSQHEI
jgi:hypothetical protein